MRTKQTRIRTEGRSRAGRLRSDMKTLSTSEFKAMLGRSQPPVVVNVLPEESFREEHIPDSENVPLGSDDFVERFESMSGGKDRPVVGRVDSDQPLHRR
jgi:hypothetical protein